MTTDIISLATAKAFLEIRDTDTSKDTVVSLLISAASEQIEQALGTTLDQQTVVDVFNTRDSTFPVLDLHGSSETGVVHRSRQQMFTLTGFQPDRDQPHDVRYDRRYVFGDGTIWTENDDYVIDWDNATLILLRGTYKGAKALRVSYTAGIAPGASAALEENAPKGLLLGCLYQTAYLYKRHRTDNVGMAVNRGVMGERSNVAGAKWNTDTGLCKEAQGHLRPYRKLALGRG